MNVKNTMISFFLISFLTCFLNCKEEDGTHEPPVQATRAVYLGADLWYVEQVLDDRGVYKDQGAVRSAYRICKGRGTNRRRPRLWHDPLWTKEVYGDDGTQLYNDLA